MDNAANSAGASDRPDLAEHSVGVGRAMLSAAVFGALGAWVGNALGKRANAPGSDVARSVMKWGMGLFSGLLAAHCSLKTSEREAEVPMDAAASSPATTSNNRATNIDASSVEHHGKAAETQGRTRI